MFWENFYEACVKQGTKPNPLGKEIGISSGIISKWKTENTLPNGETLLKIADRLNCSIDYLLGRTDNQYVDTVEEENKIIDVYRNLNDEGRKALNDYIEFISTKIEYKKYPASKQDIG